MKITTDILKKCLPKIKEPDKWAPFIAMAQHDHDLNTPQRMAAFLAQCGHESGDFNIMEENLRYSATRLTQVWPKHFPDLQIAQKYQYNPEKIANRAYRNRMGNGDEESGDGWKYRGRGIIQLTGKYNYRECSLALFGDEQLVRNPDELLQPYIAVEAACWFWNKHGLNLLADREDIVTMTKRINGGTHGLADRQARYKHCLSVLTKETNEE